MEDTIAALGTAPGKAALAVLRLSGPDTFKITDRVFRAKCGLPAGERRPGRLYFGELLDKTGAVVDLCLAVVSRAPMSYTGEDTAELHCHGSPALAAVALESLFAAGARQARAGEFTKRAFLNGKKDLTEAEAVADMVDAASPAALRVAAAQLGGNVSGRVQEVYEVLLEASSRFGAAVDFPDDGVEPWETRELLEKLRGAEEKLRGLLATYDRGRFLNAGVPTAIVGKPNVGKSTLLNALLGYDRAIVTAAPGTTRDTVSETAAISGVTLRLCDTAGLRETADPIEGEGVRRARNAARDAALVLAVLDSSRPMEPEDYETLELLRAAPAGALIINKTDLPRALEMPEWSGPAFELSAKSGRGLDSLRDWIGRSFGLSDSSGAVLTNARQAECTSRALEAVSAAVRALEEGVTEDAALTILEEGTDAVASILGKNLREDLVSDIFSRFCVGK